MRFLTGADTTRRAALLGALLLLQAGSAGAHGKAGDAPLRPVLDALPAELAGVRVQVQRTLATQIVLENAAGPPVEVLDEAGQPFLRIGPDGVFANLSAIAWYRTFGPSDAVRVPDSLVQRALAGEGFAEAQWKQVSTDCSWGWFDRRLEADESLKVPHGWREQRQAGELGRWRIPLRLGERESALTGRFRFEPPAEGAFRARLRSLETAIPGVRVSLIPGPVSAVLLENRAAQPVTALGAHGEPLLRIGPGGVEANLASATWQEIVASRAGRRERAPLPVDAGADVRWQRLSRTPRYAWIDPRIASLERPDARPGESAHARTFSIPLRAGDIHDAIHGTAIWHPAAAETIPASPPP